jgi:hypothetical protein
MSNEASLDFRLPDDADIFASVRRTPAEPHRVPHKTYHCMAQCGPDYTERKQPLSAVEIRDPKVPLPRQKITGLYEY